MDRSSVRGLADGGGAPLSGSAAAPSCSVLIVNCNGGEWIVRCVSSLLKHVPPGSTEIIVTDNASSDGSIAALRRACPQASIRIIENPENRGFGAACNQGARAATTPYLLFLNSDCEMIEDVVTPLVRQMEDHPDVGILFCRLLNTDGSLQPSVNRSLPHPVRMLAETIGWSTLRFALMKSRAAKRILLGPSVRRHGRPHEPAWGGGNFMFMRRQDFLRIGGFDEQYFLYFEDADLCRRVTKAGFRLQYLPGSAVIHHWAKSVPTGDVNPLLENYRSRLHYVAKHFGPRWRSVVRRSSILELWLRIGVLRCAVRGRSRESRQARLHHHLLALKALKHDRMPPASHAATV